MGRPTDDPKNRVLKIRINDEQFEWCKSNGGYSKVIRDLLDSVMQNNPEKEKSHVKELQIICNKQRKEIAALEKELAGISRKEKSPDSDGESEKDPRIDEQNERISELERLIEKYRQREEYLRSRCTEDAFEAFSHDNYGFIKIVPVNYGESNGDKEVVTLSALDEIESMARSVNLTADNLISDLAVKLESGEIGISGSGLTVGTVDECPFDWRQIVSACDEMSLDYSEAVKKIIPMLYKGV